MEVSPTLSSAHQDTETKALEVSSASMLGYDYINYKVMNKNGFLDITI